jgi:uncharacterized protein YjbI with pentapeptide repeats
MDLRPAVRPPRLPAHLVPPEPGADDADELELHEAQAVFPADAVAEAHRVRIAQSRLGGLRLAAGSLAELDVTDTVLDGGDLSNITARRGSVRRVELLRVRAVGFGLEEGTAQDVRVDDGTMMLASFASAGLERVLFEGVNLREASFAGARMRHVTFDGCDLTGADFRGASLRECAIRSATLDGVLGIESLRGVTMPWPDVVASAGALAAALGIEIEDVDDGIVS